jgi:hypothetical protein
MERGDQIELMKAVETQVSEMLYVIAGKDLRKSADLLDELAEWLTVMASNDRERARKRGR